MIKPTGTTDEQIIELYFRRDEAAIRETDAKYGQMLFRIAYNILHDRLDCEECKNDTYLGVWNSIPPTRPAVFPAFLARIMRNVATKRYAEKTTQKHLATQLTVSLEELTDFLHDNGSPEVDYAARELGKLISDYLRSLTRRQQYIFIGRFYMAETIEALADKLHVGVATVHRDLEKIKQGLKVYLERNGVYL